MMVGQNAEQMLSNAADLNLSFEVFLQTHFLQAWSVIILSFVASLRLIDDVVCILFSFVF